MVNISDIIEKIRLKESASSEPGTERTTAQTGDERAQSDFRRDAVLDQQERWLEFPDLEIPEEARLPVIGATLRDIRDSLASQKRAGKWMLWIAIATLVLVGTQFVLNALLDWDQISVIWAD